MEPVKILYLFEGLGIGGAEQLLLTTLKYLNREKFSPVVYCIGRNGKIAEEIEALNIKVVALNKNMRLWNLSAVSGLIKVYRREKPHIVHTHLFYANYFGRIAAIIQRVPVVVTTEHGTHGYFKKFYHHLADFILSFFTVKTIAVSRAVKEYMLKSTFIPKHKISVIYNAVDFDRFKRIGESDRIAIRRSLFLPDSSFVIGCVSNLAPWKGQFHLLRAFVKVKGVFPGAELCIIGRGTTVFQRRLESFARENNILGSVHFLGERRDVPEMLKAIDIFVFPSLTEGLGISLLEAMYMKLPVIASATEGILEIVEDNKDGILVPGGDTESLAEGIIALSKDTEKMKTMGLNAREKVERLFSPGDYIKKLESFYDDSIYKKRKTALRGPNAD